MSEATSAGELATILADYVPRSDYEGALEAIQELESERNTHRAAAEKATPRVTELEKKLRGLTAKQAFAKIADKLKIDPKFRDDVFELSKFEADSDEPDAKAMESHFAKFMEGKDHYRATEAPAPRTIPKGEGASRGVATPPGEAELRVSRKDLRDAIFMRNNQAKVSAAHKAGLLVIDDV